MKKIGILTYHYSINDGAMLQAYALQEVCKKLFSNVQVEMINYESLSAKKRDFLDCFKKSGNFSSVIAYLRRFQKLSSFKETNFSFGKNRLINDNYEKCIDFINQQNYDGIIVGSDEVWKIILGKKSIRKFPNVYWLNDKIKAKKFSYAASANKTDYKNLSSENLNFVEDSFKSYSLIGVRDYFTLGMVKNILSENESKISNLFKVIDPTILIEKFEIKPIEDKLKKRGFDFSKPTVVLNLENQKISFAAAKFFKERGWQVISVTVYCKYADINFVDILDPLEWVSVIAQCQFSVTERFHGTIFSVLGKVPFLSIEKNPQFDYFGTSKLKSLLEDLKLSENMFIYKPKDFSAKSLYEKLEYILENNDFTHVDALLNSYRQEGIEYLKKVGDSLCL
jgi:polysaccharide pyruvyl transferase WcaK-like protein